jgi:23S rRNA (cytidine1920-2'-O)/16S rRNA (cytidine1409-2'-O)-methyltransferase
MSGKRLDVYLVDRGLAATRSQAENYIKLGRVKVNDNIVIKAGTNVPENAVVKMTSPIKYVSRGALKLESVAKQLALDFRGKAVLDVGSSTGGFTDYALQHGANKVIAVDVGKNQMHGSLRQDMRIELHEQTDIRSIKSLSTKVNYCLIDVSFISIIPVLIHLRNIVPSTCDIVAMVKPQFESSEQKFKHKGVIKNETIRRNILKDFETKITDYYKILNKSDSKVAGPSGNLERFYLIRPVK